ncbi:MAG: hypothetical protein NT069_03920 [Planctomycetota bacterium]|nr:hypothetical protein [Planctomycetota bacterium]
MAVIGAMNWQSQRKTVPLSQPKRATCRVVECNFFVTPHCDKIGPIANDHVKVIVHHRKPEKLAGHQPGEFRHPANSPFIAVIVRLSRVGITPHQTRPTDAPVDAVIDPDLTRIKQQLSRDSCHGFIRFANQFGD